MAHDEQSIGGEHSAAEEGRAAAADLRGLSRPEVAERTRAGKANRVSRKTGRGVGEILRANVFTRINAMLFVLWVIVIATGSWMNAAFGLMIVANSTVGVVQELRAKRTLDKLRIVGQARPTVIREGITQEVAQEEVVLGDLLRVGSGEEIVVDGTVVHGHFAVDESQLTGESDAVPKEPGDAVRSGSFVRSGSGVFRADAVGDHAYAAKLAAAASEFSLTGSALMEGINAILRVITWLLVPTGILTIYTQLVRSGTGFRESVLAMAAALVPMIPEGLVLMTSIAFAAGVIRLGRHKALVNELVAIEGLARVNTVCTDKTGTLTTNRMELTDVLAADGTPAPPHYREELYRLLLAQEDRNLTSEALVQALREEFPGACPLPGTEIPFDSRRKFSGLQLSGEEGEAPRSALVLGAPDVLLPPGSPALVTAQAREAEGLRVLAWGSTRCEVASGAESPDVPQLEDPHLVVLRQQLREDAAETLRYFAQERVQVKVISGDNPRSVAAVARQAGLAEVTEVDTRELTAETMDTQVGGGTVFGRVTPHQKAEMVDALHRRGRTVAMTGDGVNDVLALKRADIGVAMGAGAPASRSVAQLVLLDNRFAALPHVVAEGRRVIGNIERVAHLFLTKTVYSVVLAAVVAVLGISFPFQPVYVTITGWFTIGIPAFVLSLAPNYERPRGNFVRRVLTFAVPSGVLIGLFCVGLWVMIYPGADATEAARRQAGTAVLVTLIVMGLWVLAIVARPWNWWRIGLVLAAALAYLVIFLTPLAQLVLLDTSRPGLLVAGAALGVVGAVAIEWTHRGVLALVRLRDSRPGRAARKKQHKRRRKQRIKQHRLRWRKRRGRLRLR